MNGRIHGGGYRLAWSDEFDGARGTPAGTRTWRPETGGSGWGNQELQYYTDEPGNAALDGAGNLAIVVRRGKPGTSPRAVRRLRVHLPAADPQGAGSGAVR